MDLDGSTLNFAVSPSLKTSSVARISISSFCLLLAEAANKVLTHNASYRLYHLHIATLIAAVRCLWQVCNELDAQTCLACLYSQSSTFILHTPFSWSICLQSLQSLSVNDRWEIILQAAMDADCGYCSFRFRRHVRTTNNS
jgi:hypothetical protein